MAEDLTWAQLKTLLASGKGTNIGLLRDVKARGLLPDVPARKFSDKPVVQIATGYYYPYKAEYSWNPASLADEERYVDAGAYYKVIWTFAPSGAAVPPVAGVPQPGPIAKGLTATEVTAANGWIRAGYEDQKAGKPKSDRISTTDGILPPAGQPDKTPQFYYNRGFSDAEAGRPLILIPPPAPQPTGPAPTLPAAEAQSYYDTGYAEGQARQGTRAVGVGPNAIVQQRFYEMGHRDGRNNLPRQVFPPGTLVSPVTVVDPPGPQTQPPVQVPATTQGPGPYGGRLDPTIGYELYATVLGYGGLPISVVRYAQRIAPFLVRAYLLGDSPAEYRRGFRLSGPAGAVIRQAQRDYPGLTPQQVGQPAWVGARDIGGRVELLGPREVEELLGPGWAD